MNIQQLAVWLLLNIWEHHVERIVVDEVMDCLSAYRGWAMCVPPPCKSVHKTEGPTTTDYCETRHPATDDCGPFKHPTLGVYRCYITPQERSSRENDPDYQRQWSQALRYQLSRAGQYTQPSTSTDEHRMDYDSTLHPAKCFIASMAN